MTLVDLQKWLGKVDPILGNLTGLPLYVFLIVAALTSLFTLGYLLKGGQVGLQLWLAVRRVSRLKQKGKQTEPENVGKVLRREPFKHLWEEYEDTLHQVKKARNAAFVLTEMRATVPAEMFFTREVLVDSRMFDDFTRHLPGVLTGLEIGRASCRERV